MPVVTGASSLSFKGYYGGETVELSYNFNTFLTSNSRYDYYPNIGDHCYFSSWQAEGSGPLGTPLPTISAPGAKIVAGVNHYHTASVDNNSYFHSDRKRYLILNGTSAYGVMQGTSMSAPCVSGIIALWLQACAEEGITATPDFIKEVMQNTWVTDEWTNGTGNGAHGAKTFGMHGKIDALAGLRYILDIETPTPVISVTPTELTFETTTGIPVTQTFEVTGENLAGVITATLNDENGVFSISPNTITDQEAVDGKTVTVTFSPTEEGTYTATLTLTSDRAERVTVQLSATGISVDIPNPEKCATPTISYANGKVRFACETEGVEFVPTVSFSQQQLINENELKLGGTFTVSVYAVKEDYDNSDVATITINMSQMGDVNGDGQITIADVTSLVNTILEK